MLPQLNRSPKNSEGDHVPEGTEPEMGVIFDEIQIEEVIARRL
ncbi:MAG TPA: hypothetical protein VKF81_07380 [Blastocatellia bacterium]|nr:hypothetical protein [Blastocatellia bacterium]